MSSTPFIACLTIINAYLKLIQPPSMRHESGKGRLLAVLTGEAEAAEAEAATQSWLWARDLPAPNFSPSRDSATS